jgi:hypothetical protein
MYLFLLLLSGLLIRSILFWQMYEIIFYRILLLSYALNLCTEHVVGKKAPLTLLNCRRLSSQVPQLQCKKNEEASDE